MSWGRFLFVLLCVCLARPSVAAEFCTSVEGTDIPKINVSTHVQPLDFDTTKSQEELAQLVNIEPSAGGESGFELRRDHLEGFMRGKISVSHQVHFRTVRSVQASDMCLFIDSIDVRLQLAPSIFIAHEFHDDPALFKDVFIHEKLHWEEDKKIVQKYARRLEEGLSFALADPRDYRVGPFPRSLSDVIKEELDARLSLSIVALMQTFPYERTARQNVIDSGY